MTTTTQVKPPPGEAATAERAKQKARELNQTVKTEATDAVETVKAKGSELVDEVKSGVTTRANEAKSTALNLAEDRRHQAVDKVGDYQRAARAAASKLKEEEDSVLGEHLETIAEKLGEVSNYLSSRRVPDLARDLARFTRKQPEVVLGATALAGFAIARFLKTSTREQERFEGATAQSRQQSAPVAPMEHPLEHPMQHHHPI